MATQIKGIDVNGERCEVDITSIVGFVTSPNGTQFKLKVDDNGNLYADDTDENSGTPQGPTDITALPKFYINEFYCGGKNANEHTLNYCSHNFVELSNLTTKDINLSGVTLQYAIDGTDWSVLKLKGVIKSGSTFVIRGAQCSMINSPTCKIKVDKYDMEWYTDEGKLIAFDNTSAKFYLSLNQEAYAYPNPYKQPIPGQTGTTFDVGNYIDLIGIKTTISSVVYDPGASEKSPYEVQGPINTKLFRKYYAMDPVSQATKAAASDRNNTTLWCYVDLTKNDGDVINNIEAYTPMASIQKKDIFYNKTKLYAEKPSMITCTFGIQATDNGNGATRCFNWVTSNVENNYIWIRPQSANTWCEYRHESFYEGDGRAKYTFEGYNRKVREYTGNACVVTNKFIISGLDAGVYEYIAGSSDENGEPILEKCTPIKTFRVRSNAEVANGVKFVQTSDQQGFNWEEYEVWKATAKLIGEERRSSDVQFMINTGDMTQNGNRMGEWLDYFDAKGEFFGGMEEMATVGNNDLSPVPLYKLGDGKDVSKIWHENFDIFYTFEYDDEHLPVFVGPDSKNYFIPSLYSFNYGNVHFICVNSEIKTETEINGYGFETAQHFYPQIEQWCEDDLDMYSGANWNIMMCHEMPFTILTADKVKTPDTTTRITSATGCRACFNTTKQYWLSEFCQTHNIRLVIGGHKHTEAVSYPILENVRYSGETRTVDSNHPIIVVDSSVTLVEYNGYKYPEDWFNNGEPKDASTRRKMGISTFEYAENLESGVTPVVYSMSQATGYKHTSNKELPSPDIPWLQYYFPADVNWEVEPPKATVNNNQKFPFYTIWTITDAKIEGQVRKARGILVGGKFDVNIQGVFVKQGISAEDGVTPLHSINGTVNVSEDDAEEATEIVEIIK